MSRFFVGQRVRVNMPESTMHGDQTVVLAVGVAGDSFGYEYIGNEVALTANSRSIRCVFEDHELEPILDQKHEACDEDFKRDLDRMLDKEEVR